MSLDIQKLLVNVGLSDNKELEHHLNYLDQVSVQNLERLITKISVCEKSNTKEDYKNIYKKFLNLHNELSFEDWKSVVFDVFVIGDKDATSNLSYYNNFI